MKGSETALAVARKCLVGRLVPIYQDPITRQLPEDTVEIVGVHQYDPNAGSDYGLAYCEVRFPDECETYRRVVRFPLESAD